MGEFVTGQELSRRRYVDEVAPLMASRFPGVPYAAALLGRGSEVLGFDDETSTDHDWRARVLVFLRDEDAASCADELREALGDEDVHTLRGYLRQELALDLDAPITAADWLTLPEHGLRAFTAGVVHHDEVGLGEVRERLAYYPRDVWLHLLVTGWWRLHPEMNLVGRSGSVGDELGSGVIGARLVGDVMRLCFLMEREYPPYSKWFGTAFARLGCGPAMTPRLQRVLRATSWEEREEALLAAYAGLVDLHNTLGLTEPVALEVARIWDRPFRVGWCEAPDRMHDLIEDPDVLAVAERWPVGPVDRFREIVWAPRHRPALKRVLDPSDET